MPDSHAARRGVYRLRFQGLSGERLIVAITSTNRRIAEIPVTDDRHMDLVSDLLERLLDAVDPPTAPPPPLRVL